MSSSFRRRSKIRQTLEEVQASDKEAGDSLGMDVDEDEDVLSEEPEDVMDDDEESDKEQREREDVLLQLSDPRMRPSRHLKAAMPDPTPARVRKRKSEVSEEGAADKPHACSHCGKRFGALAAMWGHQSRCAARSQNLNLEPHPFDRPKTAGKKLEPPPPPPSRTSSRAKKPVGPQEEFPCEDCGKVFPVAMRLYGHMSQCAARLRRLGKHPDSKGAKKLPRPAPAEEPEEEEEEAEAEDEGSPVNSPPGSPAEESDAPIVLRLKRPGSSAPSEPEPFTCSECGKSFASAHALGGHKGSHRNREDPSPSKPERTAEGGYQCGVCGLIFGNGQALGGHKGSHKPTDVYSEEEKQQNAKRGLLGPVTAPMRRRTVENAAEGGWACDVCGLVFSTGQALGGHKGSHKSTDYYTEEEKQSNKRRTSLHSEETPETQLRKALAALKKTMQIADAEPFNIPVDAEGLGIPDYVEVVKNPMDLGTIRTKLEKNEYPGVEEMLADVHLVSANCRLYNNEADPIVEMLEVVERRFKSEWVKAGLPLDGQGNPAAPEQEDSDVEEGGSELGEPGASPQRARRVRFAPGIQSPPLRTRPLEAPTDTAEPEEQPQEPGPRRGRGRPPGRVGSKLALKTGVSKHRPNCPCVICKQARKSPRGSRFERDSSDGEFERRGGRGDASQASHSSDEEEDGAEAAEAPEDDAPRQYYAKGAHLPPAQLSPATWRLGYQLFANSTGAILQAANSRSKETDDSRLGHRSCLATSAEQDALVPVGVNVGQLRSDGGALGPLSSGARRMGPEDVRAALAELLGSHIGVEQVCM